LGGVTSNKWTSQASNQASSRNVFDAIAAAAAAADASAAASVMPRKCHLNALNPWCRKILDYIVTLTAG